MSSLQKMKRKKGIEFDAAHRKNIHEDEGRVWLTHWQSKDSVRLPDTTSLEKSMAQTLPDSLQKETTPLTPQIWDFGLPASRNMIVNLHFFQVIQSVVFCYSLSRKYFALPSGAHLGFTHFSKQNMKTNKQAKRTCESLFFLNLAYRVRSYTMLCAM